MSPGPHGPSTCAPLPPPLRANIRTVTAHLTVWCAFAALGALCTLCALLSLALGQDANWDLRNYHLYNGWAALHGRLTHDLAPAQLQSYFVPWLDALTTSLVFKAGPKAAAMTLGAWHALALAAGTCVAWLALVGQKRRLAAALVLGLCGASTPPFLAQLGNSMGDNSTAPLVLASLALALASCRPRATHFVGPALYGWGVAGALMGLACALKLTNAPYALGLGLAAFFSPSPPVSPPVSPIRCLRAPLAFTAGASSAFALVAGPWLWAVAQHLGNPFFPLMNQWFGSPLAARAPYNDPTFLPHGLWQWLLWPVLGAAKPARIGERGMVDLIWAALYVLGIVWICGKALACNKRRFGEKNAKAPCLKTGITNQPRNSPRDSPRDLAIDRPSAPPSNRATDPTSDLESELAQARSRMLAVFFLISWLAWMIVFSIHRYLLALGLIAPTALWLLARAALPVKVATRGAAALVAGTTAAGLAVALAMWGFNVWPRQRWAPQAYSLVPPVMDDPSTSTVLIVGLEPQSWRIALLPPQAAYVGIATNMTQAGSLPPAYDRAVRDIAQRRGGPVYALFPAQTPSEPCMCHLDWLTHPQARALARLAPNAALIEEARSQLQSHGWHLVESSCTVLASKIGGGSYPYHWCRATLLP